MIRKNTSSFCDRPKRYLSDKHRDDLRESGLTDETIERCGFHTESDSEIVRQYLNWEPGDQLETMGPFLAIPYSDRQARRTGFIRYKPDAPRSSHEDNDKWKPVKYESPRGVPARPYFPVAALSAINTSGADLFITEGEKKAAKTTQEGFPCIGLPGVTNWSRMSDNYQIIFGPGFYLNAAPTRMGKTMLDIHRARQAKRSIFLVPTHDQEADLVSMGHENGLTIIPYPIRSKATCPRFDEVRKLEEQGFNLTEILCPNCKYKPGRAKTKPCQYYEELDTAKKALHVCATHERFRLTGEGLLENRDFVSIQEDAINVQAGVMTARTGFDKLADLAWWAELNGGNHSICDALCQAAVYFNNKIRDAERTEIIPEEFFPWEYRRSSKSIYGLIQIRDRNNERFGRPRIRRLVRKGRAVQEVRPGWNYVPSGLLGGFDPDAVRFMTAVLSGRFSRIYLNVCEAYKNERIVELLGVLKVPVCEKSIIVFGDATADTELVSPEFRGKLTNITPQCQPERLQDVVQYPVDITRTTSGSRFIGIVRELLRLHPNSHRVGIITHKCLEEHLGPTAKLLTPEERERIVRVDHFFGTESRGSNSWKKECDALFVLGTPRPPESLVQSRLLQLDNVEAARESDDWSRVDYWTGRRLDGRRETVRTRGYRNHDWHEAFRQIVRAELVQSIGRARPYNMDGIPTAVVSIEDVDVPLANDPLQLLNDADAELAELEHFHLGLMMDAILLRHILGRTHFGPYLPHTRHRLYRQVDYLLSSKHGQSLRKSKVRPVDEFPETNSFALLAAMPVLFAETSSPLRERIYKFRDSYCKK